MTSPPGAAESVPVDGLLPAVVLAHTGNLAGGGADPDSVDAALRAAIAKNREPAAEEAR